MTDNFLIIGGGERMRHTAAAFSRKGFNAKIFDASEPLKTAIDKANVIILGLPASTDDTYADCDNSIRVPLRDIAALCGKEKLLLGGRMSEKVKALFDVYCVRWADYSMRDDFEILNAIPTAEGAIAIAMEEFPFTIHSSRVIVTGFGKVAKALSIRLRALGAHCIVAARSLSAQAEAKSLGLDAIPLSLLPQEIKRCRILFNTVPAKIIGKEVLSEMGPDKGIIDLASKPGGVDLDMAKTFGVNVIWALSLPGKVAPETAGEIIMQSVCNIADELHF